MLRYLEERRIARNRQRDGIDTWKQEVLHRLLSKVIPSDEPYHYDVAFSFLQKDRTLLTQPVRVTLFFPNYPLAVDLVGADGRLNYLESRHYIRKPDWDALQANVAMKAERLSLHRCPYLIIRDIDPIDAFSLRDRFKSHTGRRLRS
jgi:hypothetical protein